SCAGPQHTGSSLPPNSSPPPPRHIHRYRRAGLARAGAMLVWPRNVTGAQTARRRGSEIAAVRRDHHALGGREVKCLTGCEIDARFRFVVARDLRAENGIPGKNVAAREINHKRNISV